VSHTELAVTLLEYESGVVVLDNCSDVNGAYLVSCRKTVGKVISVSSVDLNLKAARGYQLYKVAGWTLREYQAACTNTAFYNSDKQNLHTDGFTAEDLDDPLQRSDIVAAKFHLSGANARWMFGCSTGDLLCDGASNSAISLHIADANMCSVRAGMQGNWCDADINHLFSCTANREVTFVSHYVANGLAIELGGELVSAARALLGHNHAVDAVIAKIDFLSRLGRGLQRSAYI
jgi:hypothetical protein